MTPKKATWRKWHNQPGLLARQAADERRYDRLLGRFDIIHHITTTRSDFVSPFFVPTSVAANLYLNRSPNPFRQPVPSTRSINPFHQPVPSTCHNQPVISSVTPSVPPCSPSPQSALQPAYQPVIVIAYFVCDFACYQPDYCPVISLLLCRQD